MRVALALLLVGCSPAVLAGSDAGEVLDAPAALDVGLDAPALDAAEGLDAPALDVGLDAAEQLDAAEPVDDAGDDAAEAVDAFEPPDASGCGHVGQVCCGGSYACLTPGTCLAGTCVVVTANAGCCAASRCRSAPHLVEQYGGGAPAELARSTPPVLSTDFRRRGPA